MSLGSAFSAFFGILFNKDKASLWQQANSGSFASEEELKAAKEQADKLSGELTDSTKKIESLSAEVKDAKEELNKPSDGEDAVYTLALLQREGRLIDFLKEDISAFEDAQIGAAVRQVHEGCKKVLDKHFAIEAIVNSTEGETVNVEKGFDPSSYELSGNVTGEAPYSGELRHKGWQASKVELPIRQKGRNSSVIYPAEVEI
ncbi:MAG: DUF2760 domain-containing protein [Lentisphaeraceae bacterium]|nr:DUF2760 domain-containing protein [Lentisphaeraceae bacterium]